MDGVQVDTFGLPINKDISFTTHKNGCSGFRVGSPYILWDPARSWSSRATSGESSGSRVR